jgi:hypothetical protein
MKLYVISQEENNGYDTYDSVVVAAETPTKARRIRPCYEWDNNYGEWATDPKNVTVKYIGEAKAGTEEGIILASFNAG